MIQISVSSHCERKRSVFMEGTVCGHTYGACPDYLLKDGKPYTYRMGEFHYSRYPASSWRQELQKMKDGGIQIVSSYVFWLHHEPIEGQFSFTGSCNIRQFVDLCQELGLLFWLRIGPWAHGEARNGGFPDWLEGKCNGRLRCMDDTYLAYVRRFFTEFYRQIAPCKNIIGIQVENEMPDNPDYLACIRDMLQEIGYSAPFWSATAWGIAKLPDGLLPMYGGYPEAPWMEHTHKLKEEGVSNFFFSPQREDGIIGADLLNYAKTGPSSDPYDGRFPFLTCELGGGIPTSYHRRPRICSADIGAIATCKLGSGARGLGYYVYHGSRNPILHDAQGNAFTTQESRETGYLNDYPRISYDFQAPLGDFGQKRESYAMLQRLHRFLDVVGEDLAAMDSFFPETRPADLTDTATPRVAVRSDGSRGFVFFNNHQHAVVLPPKKDTLHLLLADGTLDIPLDFPTDAYGVIPFRFRVGSEVLNWITAMPVVLEDQRVVFAPLPGICPAVCHADGSVQALRSGDRLGGLQVEVLEAYQKPRQKLLPVSFEKTPNRMDFACFSHIRPQWTKKLTDETSEYTVTVPEGASFLLVDAAGNLGACFDMAGTLLSDHYLDGLPWVIDVRGYHQVILKIQPLTKEDAVGIYLETEMPLGEMLPQIAAVAGDEVFI